MIGALTTRKTIKLPYPHPGQRIVRRQARRFNWLSAGRRWRKTTLCMAIAVEEALRGKTILWGAPVYDQVRVGWQETSRAVRGVAQPLKSEMIYHFPTGGSILFRSLDDPDSARGRTADGVVIDECADVAESAWYEVLRPMLMDTGGWAWGIGTPKGQNWFAREYASAVDREDSRSWNAPTLGVAIENEQLVRQPHPLENPNIAFEELQQMFRTMPRRVFEQEVMAVFQDESGGVFRGVRDAVDKDRTEPDAWHNTRRYSAGVDLARIEDFTVIDVVDDLGRQVYHERFNQISWERQQESIKRVAKQYRCPVVLDTTGVGDPIFEALRKAGLQVVPFQFTNASKEQLIDNLAMRIEQGEARLMDIDVQTNELLAYQYELTPSRNVRMNAPAGMHDDTVIALGLAYWGLKHNTESFSFKR